MVVCIVPGMGTTLEGADRLEADFPGHRFLPPKNNENKGASSNANEDCGVLAELYAMNALHKGLFDVLRDTMGVDFTAVVGVSASEPCGLLSLAGALRDLDGATNACAEIYKRLQGAGSMLVVFDVSKKDILEVIAQVGGTTALGAWFGAAAGAITGSTADMTTVRLEAEKKGWKHMVPRTGYGDRIPFHCPAMFAPYRSLDLFRQIELSPPRLSYFSSFAGGKLEDETLMNDDFMFSSLAESARTFDAIRACIRAGHRKFVELNLKPLYIRTVEEAFAAEGVTIDEGEIYCCGPSKADMESLANKLSSKSRYS